MVALKIDDVKQFTSGLLVGEVFDQFWLKEAEISTFSTFAIDGRIHPGYYTKEELEESGIGELCRWKAVKPFCFSLIKGKRLPGSFKIVLQVSEEEAAGIFSRCKTAGMAEQVGALYLNIRYDENGLYCVTGASMKSFTLDKSADQAWDEAAKEFLKNQGILYTE